MHTQKMKVKIYPLSITLPEIFPILLRAFLHRCTNPGDRFFLWSWKYFSYGLICLRASPRATSQKTRKINLLGQSLILVNSSKHHRESAYLFEEITMAAAESSIASSKDGAILLTYTYMIVSPFCMCLKSWHSIATRFPHIYLSKTQSIIAAHHTSIK